MPRGPHLSNLSECLLFIFRRIAPQQLCLMRFFFAHQPALVFSKLTISSLQPFPVLIFRMPLFIIRRISRLGQSGIRQRVNKSGGDTMCFRIMADRHRDQPGGLQNLVENIAFEVVIGITPLGRRDIDRGNNPVAAVADRGQQY